MFVTRLLYYVKLYLIRVIDYILLTFSRSCSESRQPLSFAQHEKKTSVTPSQQVSQDVKQRTIASIQEWKNRMSKPQSSKEIS